MHKHNNISQIKKTNEFCSEIFGLSMHYAKDYCDLRSNPLQIVTCTCLLWLNMTWVSDQSEFNWTFIDILIVFSGKTLAFT